MLAGAMLDQAITLTLLAIAAGLLGLPGGYALIRKDGSGDSTSRR